MSESSGDPLLLVRLAGREWLRLAPPAFGARAWLLGVVAVQLVIDDVPYARVRAHATGGGAARTIDLPANEPVHITLLGPAARPPRLPRLTWRPEASLAVYLNGEFIDAAPVPPPADRPLRGFGHVFCRWLRSGGIEPGFDLTDVIAPPPGRMYERRLSRPLAVGQTVSYRFTT